MHNAALKELGLADEWRYEAIEVDAEEFEPLVRELANLDYAGVNVTVPHKLRALAVSDTASELARRVGAANTLVFDDGRIHAENTDAQAVTKALPEPYSSEAGTALVLGAGGAARAAVCGLSDAGLRVAVWNRTSERAEELARDLGARVVDGDEVRRSSGEFDVIVNATTVGMRAAEAGEQAGDEEVLSRLPLDIDAIGPVQLVIDLVYGVAETPLVRQARARGADVVDGIEILVLQGAIALEIWTGRKAPLEVMRRAARRGSSE
jgi:shikimate dehydrogenase